MPQYTVVLIREVEADNPIDAARIVEHEQRNYDGDASRQYEVSYEVTDSSHWKQMTERINLTDYEEE